MSFTPSGVKVNKPRNGVIAMAILTLAEFVLSVLFVVSLAGPIVFPNNQARAAAGVSDILSYQGRLTDSGGNPLTNTYCFRFSIYDVLSGGNNVWPGGTPTSNSVNVSNGVFNIGIGEADDLSAFDFSATSTLYLNVEVNQTASTCSGSWESLAPRQRIDAAAYARVAEKLYGGEARIGIGAGTASPKMLLLDVKNVADALDGSCSINGTIWYNSANTRALICENGAIKPISNASTTIAAVKEQGASLGIVSGTVNFSGQANITISQNNQTLQFSVANPGILGIGASNTTYTSGTVVISGGANVTVGTNGQTITISAAAGGGGGGATVSHWPPLAFLTVNTSSNYTGATTTGTNITASYHVAPLQLLQALSFSRIDIVGSFATVAGTGSNSLAHMLGIYTLNGNTALSRSTSYMWRNEISQNSVTALTHRWYWGTDSNANSSSTTGNFSANVSGPRRLPLYVGGDSFSAGQYWLVYAQTNISSGSNIMPAASIQYFSSAAQSALGGYFATASSSAPFPLMGHFSSTIAVGNFTTPIMPASINTTAITATSSAQWKVPFVLFRGK